jgi:hypothetical protein
MNLLFTGNNNLCVSSGKFTELIFSGILIGVGAVVHLRSYFSQELNLIWEKWFIYGAVILREH